MNKEEKERLQEIIWDLEEHISNVEFHLGYLKQFYNQVGKTVTHTVGNTDRRRLFLLEVFYRNARQTTKTWEAERARRASRLLRALDYRKMTGMIEAPMSTWKH